MSTVLEDLASTPTPTPTPRKRKRTSGRADIARAHANDAADYTLSPAQVIERTRSAVRYALPRLSDDETDALASELRIYVARRHGWAPRHSQMARVWLAKRAVTIARDLRQWRDVAEADSLRIDAAPAAEDDELPAEHRSDALRTWLGEDLPAPDRDWSEVAAALACEATSPDADAVFAALSGYGSGTELAAARGYSDSYAGVRLWRGRKALRERYPHADDLVAALIDADAADRPLAEAPVPIDPRRRPLCPLSGHVGVRAGMFSALRAINPDTVPTPRPRIDSAAQAARWLLDYMAPTATLPHTAQPDGWPERNVPALTAPGNVASVLRYVGRLLDRDNDSRPAPC